MRFLAKLFLCGVIGLSGLSGDENNRNYAEKIEEWIEVPELVHEEIATDPWFSNTSRWRVFSTDGKAYAKPLGIRPDPPPLSLKLPSGEEELTHGAAVEVARGWLASYYREYPIGGRKINSVYWISKNKQRKLLLEGGWVMQFLPSRGSGDVFAGTETGIVRFCSQKKWLSVQEVNFNFGMVYGITYSPAGGFLVFSRSGWWEVGEDDRVNQVEAMNDIQVNGVSICRKEDSVYVGGGAFVTEISLSDLSVRELCPSSQYLHAMRTMTRREFEKFMARRSQSKTK